MEDKILLMKEAMGMSDRLFDIANAFSGDETGLVAMLLHCACSMIWTANKAYNSMKKGDHVETV